MFAPDLEIGRISILMRNVVLPFVFYAVILAHVGAVLKHHFGEGRKDDGRRMLTCCDFISLR